MREASVTSDRVTAAGGRASDCAIPPPGCLTPAQCRAGRALVGWTQEDLADKAGLCRSTVRDFEKGRHELQRGSAAMIRAALESSGVALLGPEAGMGPGVRLVEEPR